ncbi:MAG: dihydropteroate synthase [Lachnospiraceae bacterium]|nr:dihydropteroate synthase [Lachnospiraceae bacterium]
MVIGRVDFVARNHTYVMGILNVTPDSFYDGGNYTTVDKALFRAEAMIKEGADIIDIGGESTRPGYEEITPSEEIKRVEPVIKKIKSEFNIPISLDTYNPETAKAGIEAGADLINDIWGLDYDPEMGKIIKEHDVACCLMHNRREHDYEDFKTDFYNDMEAIIKRADEAGIRRDRIILDPGIGFQKTTEENRWVIKDLANLNKYDLPVLVGASRKSVVGNTLNLPKEERLEGTLAITALSVMAGMRFVRVHDVKENKRVISMMEAVRNEEI